MMTTYMDDEKPTAEERTPPPDEEGVDETKKDATADLEDMGKLVSFASVSLAPRADSSPNASFRVAL